MSLRVERPVWRDAAVSFVPPRRREAVDRILAHTPVALILLAQAVLALRLSNMAHSDEALYINAGHTLFSQGAGGAAVRNYGAYFSGHPYAYPALAAVLDSVGGLRLVRFASAMFMLVVTLCAGAVARHLAGEELGGRARLAAMTFCALTGSVAFVGNFATYDAICVMGIAVAAMLAATREGYLSAIGAGLALAGSAVCKYAGGGFLPIVVMLALFGAGSAGRRVLRSLLAGGAAVAGMLAVYLPTADLVTAGIEFTTLTRRTQAYHATGLLVRDFALGAGLILGLALVGLVVDLRSGGGLRSGLLALTLVAGGLAIPLSQLRMNEYTSFNKHLVFVGLFLTPLAAQIVRISKPLARTVLIGFSAYVVGASGMERAQFMFTEWPDATRVVALVEQQNRPGIYLGVGADSMAYYSKDHPQLRWEEPWVLFGAGRKFIRTAIQQRKYAGVIYTTGGTGNAELDANTAFIAELLAKDANYELAGSWPKHRYDANMWMVYLRKSGVAEKDTARSTVQQADPKASAGQGGPASGTRGP